MFKFLECTIVQTVENGKPQLCIVPESWEMNGILFWPKNKADKLVKSQSMPGHPCPGTTPGLKCLANVKGKGYHQWSQLNKNFKKCFKVKTLAKNRM